MIGDHRSTESACIASRKASTIETRQLKREPPFTADGWKGMMASFRQLEPLREFPTQKRLLTGLPKVRSQKMKQLLARAFGQRYHRGGNRHRAASRRFSWSMQTVNKHRLSRDHFAAVRIKKP
ncbi:hypothetical protein [Sphingomonas psychrolutea]|uniref:hypothetical protein n=1 Tax=Sphingomonas psychrolutea TaxID=1259676 RepID=UPI001E4814F2|nr:hypothetical protein [Sphingomonas psychrolutea]